MKYLLILIPLITSNFLLGQTSITEAQDLATKDNKKILLVFTGSDWCKPCIQLKKNILDTKPFKEFSNDSIIQLDVDFPYKRQNKLSKEQTAHNEELADTYNKQGDFPKMVLINSDLSIVEYISYSSKMHTDELINEIKKYL